MAFDKVRIRFRKDGDLRLVSHHDLMRALERMLRRSQLPFRSTEGFHPQPRMVFALSLPLGVSGLNEVLEIEWNEPVEPDDALSRLRGQTPNGLSFLSAKRIDIKQSAKPRLAFYRLSVPESEIVALAERCAAAIAGNELWVERERPKPRQVNIRPYIHELRCSPSTLEMALWVSPEGSARADELVRALELQHVIDAGGVIERVSLEIEDEVDPAQAIGRPTLPNRDNRSAWERPSNRLAAPPVMKQESASAHWGASPNGPIVE